MNRWKYMKKYTLYGTASLISLTTAGSLAASQSVLAAQDTEDVLESSEFFTERELEQTPDTSEAEEYTLSDEEDIHITEEGVYVISGEAENTTIYVEAPEDAKVHIVLDGVQIANEGAPAIYVSEADKVFVTTVSDSELTESGAYTSDVDSWDSVIFSRADLVLNGEGTLTIESDDAGVVSKDDLKVTGGTYEITAQTKALEANDSIQIADGEFELTVGTDALHAENESDDSKGYIYIEGGSFVIDAADDGIHGTSVVRIDGGTFEIEAVEAIEATYVQINGGTIDIYATDDGINASDKSTAYSPTVEITGGDITIEMGQGDTDAIDSNGDLIISGGNLDITAQSAIDYEYNGTFTGGSITVNGEEVTELTQSGPGGGFGGGGGGLREGNGNGNGGFGGDMKQKMPGGNSDRNFDKNPDGNSDKNSSSGSDKNSDSSSESSSGSEQSQNSGEKM